MHTSRKSRRERLIVVLAAPGFGAGQARACWHTNRAANGQAFNDMARSFDERIPAFKIEARIGLERTSKEDHASVAAGSPPEIVARPADHLTRPHRRLVARSTRS